MKKITTNPHGIQTPTTVSGFRENLKKYYVVSPINRDDELTLEEQPINNLTLQVNVHIGVDESGENEFNYYDIPLMDLTSLTDLYEICEDGEPMVTPKIDTTKDLKEFLTERFTIGMEINFFSYRGYFRDENNFKIYDTTEDLILKGNPKNWDLSSQLLREFLVMTLGDYSGYEDIDYTFTYDGRDIPISKEMMN
jgi:hypothetical protein|tara:strand:- start:22 stop:606 length:585 start_codon:yes stop_codon:yes gene_type:complete